MISSVFIFTLLLSCLITQQQMRLAAAWELKWQFRQPADKDLIVNTRFGPVQGIHFPSNYTEYTQNSKSNNKKLMKTWPYAYVGIPFALPPIGERRFKSPEPWNSTWKQAYGKETLVANTVPPQCIQVLTSPFVPMSENCLQLNVFTPSLDRKKRGRKLLPVMFWVYGGAYSFGSSWLGNGPHDNIYSGSFVTSKKDVIMVTFNHRISATGFLITDSVHGNMGLDDVKLAYKWTVENIEAFGGDPNEITAFGMSSGAYISLLLALDPRLPPLKRVIAMSPPIGLKAKSRDVALKGGKDFLKVTKCDEAVDELACLQKMSSLQLTKGNFLSDQSWLSNVIKYPLKWLPVVDKANYIDRPLELLQYDNEKLKSRISNTEFMVGVTKHEAALFVALAEGLGRVPGGTFLVFRGNRTVKSIILDWLKGDRAVQVQSDLMTHEWYVNSQFHERQYASLIYQMFSQDADVAQEVLKHYPSMPTLQENVDRAVEVVTDYLFICPARYFANTLNRNAAKSVYMYELNYEAKYISKIIGSGSKYNHTPIAHSIDVPFFFNYQPVLPDEDEKVANMYTDYFTSFATGNINNHCNPSQISAVPPRPAQKGQQQSVFSTSGDCESTLPYWEQFTSDRNNYLSFEQTNTRVKSDLNAEKCAFWDSYKNPKAETDGPYQFN